MSLYETAREYADNCRYAGEMLVEMAERVGSYEKSHRALIILLQRIELYLEDQGVDKNDDTAGGELLCRIIEAYSEKHKPFERLQELLETIDNEINDDIFYSYEEFEHDPEQQKAWKQRIETLRAYAHEAWAISKGAYSWHR